MKGITPVIATILLLMITIALIGFIFVWFTGMTSKLANQTTRVAEETTERMQTSAKIDAVDTMNGVLSIRNTGSINLKLSEVGVYVNDSAIVTDCSFSKSELAPGETDSCSSGAFQDCTNVMITTIGTGDIKSC